MQAPSMQPHVTPSVRASRRTSPLVQSLSASLARLDGFETKPLWVLTNPPYGVRVGDQAELRDLYATIGNAFAGHSGRRLGLLTADKALAAQLRLPLRSRFDSRN